MSKLKIITVGITLIAVITGVLLYNKSRSAAKARSDVLTTIPVSVMKVTRERLSDAHSFVGTVAANNDVAVVSETQGKVVAVMATVGDYKDAGSVIVQVDDELKQASFETAEVNFQKGKKDLERFESLAKQEAATDQQVDAARLAFKAAEAQYIVARRQLRDTKITTPISGVVTARPVDVGTYIQSGTVVANVVDISKLKVKLNVGESDVFRLKIGDKVEVTTDVYPGVPFEGRIQTISAKADEAHTYPVEIGVANHKDHRLKAGMFGRVSLISIGADPALTISRGALVGSLKKPQVFVVNGTISRLRDIIVGSEFGTRLTVLNGLTEGETVVVAGQNNLKDGGTVSVVK
ncbi:MAG: efflux RND transporter periplasmic adaptor subunit [Ignavibacteria bacterium]|nr:efflux RND transporter periplasmic adaptor subunit [Ignavibacteria bacterium]MBI3766812.1 efflux RND transporter periplasmic adaptor subunit [Ignavibacteriales bacterium]